jgi:predicted alpha/beta hydrolase
MQARPSRPVRPHTRIVRAADGYPLSTRIFEPRDVAVATVVINPALAVGQAFYGKLAQWLADHGVRAVTFDYRGVADSRHGPKLPQASLGDWGRLDAPAVFRHVRARYGAPTVLVAHSIGGQFLGFADDYRASDAVIVVAASLSHWRLYRGRQRRRLAAYGTLVPAVSTTLGRFPAWMGMGMDLPAGVGTEWSRWIRDPHWFLGSHPDTRARLARFDRPIRFYSFSDDELAPAPTVRAFLDTLETAPVDHRRVAPADLGVSQIGHFGFFRPRFEDPFWGEILELVQRTRAGADAAATTSSRHGGARRGSPDRTGRCC